jgi:hypothetical protein
MYMKIESSIEVDKFDLLAKIRGELRLAFWLYVVYKADDAKTKLPRRFIGPGCHNAS